MINNRIHLALLWGAIGTILMILAWVPNEKTQAFEERQLSSVDRLSWSLEEAKRRCSGRPSISEDKFLSRGSFSRSITLEEMNEKFEAIYKSGRRLPRPVYYDEKIGQFVMERDTGYEIHQVRVPDYFIESVIRHVEESLAKGYADFVFFSDMGHAHLLVPNDFFDEAIRRYPFSPQESRTRLFEAFYSNPDVMFLYHTAEELKMNTQGLGSELIDDDHIQWRYLNRNPVGTNGRESDMIVLRNLESPSNTVKSLEGYRYRAGFSLSSSHEGCIPYIKNGQVYYFDINLGGLVPPAVGF